MTNPASANEVHEADACYQCPLETVSVRWRPLVDAKNPYGYCPDHGTGVSCPIGVVSADG